MTDEQQPSSTPIRLNPALVIFLICPAMGILVAVSMALSSRQSSVTITPPIVTFAYQSLVNSTAPDFTLQTPNGVTIQLSNLRGKWVFLNFWATWCPPCRQ